MNVFSQNNSWLNLIFNALSIIKKFNFKKIYMRINL